MKSIISVLLVLFSINLMAEDLQQEFDSLGGNRVLLEKAKALNPETQISIVQNRTVERRRRLEISPEFSGTFGGDTYTRTQNYGLNLHYHFTPRWSLGVKYNYSMNKLTDEGESLYNQAAADAAANPADPRAQFPEVDYQKSQTLAVLNWYPIYGKMNLLDKAVAHFDIYGLLGYGNVELRSGTTPLTTAGAGFGFWLTQHFSTRFEMRFESFKAKYYSGDKNMNTALASLQMGWLL